jgi:[NiFe] hydrogenase diaphorase moiety large subunit
MISKVKEIIGRYEKNQSRLMDILINVQAELGFISQDATAEIAKELGLSKVDVEQTLSFYHFFSDKPTGKFVIFLNNSVVSNMMGRKEIVEVLEKEAGCKFGDVSSDGLVGLFDTSCIGMTDQEPAAIINGIVFTKLTPFRAKEIIRDIKRGKSLNDLIVESYGDGMNNTDLIKAMVYNNIRKIGPVLSDDYKPGRVIKDILPKLTPEQVIEQVKLSNIRGRGGAGFPTGLKWEFCRKAHGTTKYIFCNADEGEPGTFKDRVILTERPKLLFEGMVVGAYAIGASEGILYVRYEYKYLQNYLEDLLKGARDRNLLGKDIGGIKGFDFDIRIQFGAGAYVCGEESALIESAEGKRGEPRDRPPFPIEVGYLGMPTVVNNVETFCSVVKIMINGGAWYRSFGTRDSTGTKLISISGDCKYPGVYEIEWGFNVNDILAMVGAENVQAVQIGGPSGSLIAKNEFVRTLSFEDLSTGGSIIIFDKSRNLLKDVVLNFTEFFIEESCGSCVPCRTVPTLMRERLMKILNKHGTAKDVESLIEWSKMMKTNRCGLGHTAANSILSSIKNFRHLYDDIIHKDMDYDSEFDLGMATAEAAEFTKRKGIV